MMETTRMKLRLIDRVQAKAGTRLKLESSLLGTATLMRGIVWVLATNMMLSVVTVPFARAAVIIGANVVGVQQLNEQQRGTLLDQLKQAGVTTIRTGCGEQYLEFLTRAAQYGINAVCVVYPTHLGTNAHVRPAAPSVGLYYDQEPITDADQAKFEPWFTTQIAALDAAGVRLAAIEVGNEINGPFFNGDFLPSLATGRVLGIADLNNPADPEGKRLSASYRAYLQIVAVVKKVRDHAKLNHAAPVISAGLADGGLPGKKPGQKLDGVAIPSSILFFRQNGGDSLMDGYAVHVYPGGNPNAAVSARIAELANNAFSECTEYRPCWVTEWGFNNRDQTCPLNEQVRIHQIQVERQAFAEFEKQKRLAALIFYSWSGSPGTKEEIGAIFRCGALTDAGKLALSPLGAAR